MLTCAVLVTENIHAPHTEGTKNFYGLGVLKDQTI